MSLRSIHAWRENQRQPDLCEAGARSSALPKTRAWIERPAPLNAWLCRAGPLAKIGHALVSGIEGRDCPRFASVPTANLVSGSRACPPNAPLVIRFGHSGDSAESLDRLSALPPTTSGRQLVLRPGCGVVARHARRPERMVLLGAGLPAFPAWERTLMVMALAAGAIPGLPNLTLGFRHRPQSVVGGATDMVPLPSPRPHAARYDNTDSRFERQAAPSRVIRGVRLHPVAP